MRGFTRPSDQELQQFAALIAENRSATPEINLSGQDYLDRLDYHGITVLAEQTNRLPAELSSQIRQRKAMMVANDTLKQNALIELFKAFQAARLFNCVLFKGSALAYSVYPQPWLRPRSDSDCLIDHTDYDAFSKVLESLGYLKLFAIEGKYVSYQSTFTKALAGKSVMNIDLHWRINNRQSLAKAYTAQELLIDGQKLSSLSPEITIPCAVDSLLIASLHRLGHHQSEERLTWLYDIHLLAKNLAEGEWQSLLNKATRKQLCAITLDALQSCEQLFGTYTPNEVKRRLARPHSEPSRFFLQRDLPEWRYFMHDLKALDGVPAKFGLLKENVFPNPDYIRQQMNTRSAALGYLKRFVRGLKRVSGT